MYDIFLNNNYSPFADSRYSSMSLFEYGQRLQNQAYDNQLRLQRAEQELYELQQQLMYQNQVQAQRQEQNKNVANQLLSLAVDIGCHIYAEQTGDKSPKIIKNCYDITNSQYPAQRIASAISLTATLFG